MKPPVFHGSPKQGLKILNPTNSKHGQVFASTNFTIASFFVGRYGGDYTCTIHNPINGVFPIVERYSGALEKRYDRSGSIYTLNGDNFFEDGEWQFEVKSNSSNRVLHEKAIPNALEHLILLEKQGDILLYRYPNRPFFVPDDDNDLLQKTVHFIEIAGYENVMSQLKKFHPKLYERAQDILKKTD